MFVSFLITEPSKILCRLAFDSAEPYGFWGSLAPGTRLRQLQAMHAGALRSAFEVRKAQDRQRLGKAQSSSNRASALSRGDSNSSMTSALSRGGSAVGLSAENWLRGWVGSRSSQNVAARASGEPLTPQQSTPSHREPSARSVAEEEELAGGAAADDAAVRAVASIMEAKGRVWLTGEQVLQEQQTGGLGFYLQASDDAGARFVPIQHLR